MFDESLYKKPQLRDWLPEKEKINKLYQEAINNLYLYGREWLQDRLKSSTFNSTAIYGDSNSSTNHFLLLETQLLKQWDLVYMYMSRNNTKLASNRSFNGTVLLNATSVTNSESYHRSEVNSVSKMKLYRNMKKMVSFVQGKDAFDYKHFALIIKDNLGILFTVLESFYLILKGKFLVYAALFVQ